MEGVTLKTHHVYSKLKRLGNDRLKSSSFHLSCYPMSSYHPTDFFLYLRVFLIFVGGIEKEQWYETGYTRNLLIIEAAHQWCSYEKVFWKYAADLQEKTHAKLWFQ